MRARVFGKVPLRQKLARIVLGLVAVLGGVAVFWALGFLWFVATIPKEVEDRTTITDAIVVLTGGSDRVTTGLELLAEGLGPRLLISGVHPTVDVPDILRLSAGHPDLAQKITLGYQANSTLGNADETALWVARERVDSIRLVTGAYHMPRSLLELRRTLPNLKVIPHPVFPGNVKSWEWWRWPGTTALLATEYSKYLAANIRHMILPKGPLQ